MKWTKFKKKLFKPSIYNGTCKLFFKLYIYIFLKTKKMRYSVLICDRVQRAAYKCIYYHYWSDIS